MTISTSVRRAGPFTGTGASVDYPFTFKAFAPADITPYQTDANGNERRLDYPAEYIVILNPNQESHPGGTVRLNTALEPGHKLTIISDMPVAQPVDFTNQGGFYPRTLNDSLDRLTIYVQQLGERMGRALLSSVNAGFTPDLPGSAPKKFLRWSDDGRRLVNDPFDIDAVLSELERLRTSVGALGGEDVLRTLARLEAIEQNARSLRTDLIAARGVADAAKSIADKALPTSGGTLSGHVLTRYDHSWVGTGFDNTSSNPGGVFIDSYRKGVIQGSQQIRFQSDGGTNYALQLTPPGDATRERREDFMRVDANGIWHKVYGNLHDLFVSRNDVHHEYFPSHYNGTEVWWHKRLTLKIALINITAHAGQWRPAANSHYPFNNDVHLPSVFNGNAIVLGRAHSDSNNIWPTAIQGIRHSDNLIKIQGFNSANVTAHASILVIGYSNR